MRPNDYFLAVYTNEVKDYATSKFFEHLNQFKVGGVVDNSANPAYYRKIQKLTSLPVYPIRIAYNPRETLFQRNVAESVQFLRRKFLETSCRYFLILESDVIVGPDFLSRLDKAVQMISGLSLEDKTKWGAIGCLYYQGFHDYSKLGIEKTHHVLSGATVYRREAIEKYDFRWSTDNLGAFPDAWWSIDAGKDYSLWNDYDIRLEHLHSTNGTRYSKQL